MGRMTNTVNNIKYSFLSQIISLLLKFVSRTVFLKTLGVAYSGVSGLYSNVLGILALSEMGFSSAMTFALYKPMADNNTEKLQSLMGLYKKFYRIVAVVIAVLGICLVPFLPSIIKGGEEIGFDKLTIYYLISLLDTVLSYFVSYKYSMVYAEQKGYIHTRISTIFNTALVVLQIIGLLLFKNYVIYLCLSVVVGLIQKFYLNNYLNKRYPFLKAKRCKPLDSSDVKDIKKNVKALVLHNVGAKCIYQTDNIIISAFISIVITGCVSYYLMVIHAVNSFINTVLTSAVSSIGNVIATESKKKQKDIIDKYVFITLYLSGFAAVGFSTLLSPFVELLWGSELVLGNSVVLLLVMSVYITFQLDGINIIKTAAGIFDEDKFVPIVQAIINIVVSILLARHIGLAGVYIGTIVQAIVALIWKSIITYKVMFKSSIYRYIGQQIYHFILVIISTALCLVIRKWLFVNGVNIWNFAIMTVFVVVIPNMIFIFGSRNKKEMKFVFDILKKRGKKCTHI